MFRWTYTFRGDVPSHLAPKKRGFSGLTPNPRASRRCRERRFFAVYRLIGPTKPLTFYRWTLIGATSVAVNLVGWGLLGHHLGRPAAGPERDPVEVSLIQPPPRPRLVAPLPPPPPPTARRAVVPPPRRCDPPPPRRRRVSSRPKLRVEPRKPPRQRPTPSPRLPPREPPAPRPPRREAPKPPKKRAPREAPATAALPQNPEGDQPAEATDRDGPSPATAPDVASPVRTRPAPPPARPTVDLGRLKSRIHAAIARHRHYPRLARRRGLEGTVVLAFRISKAGTIKDLRVVQSAGPLLDDAARAAVRKAGRLPPHGELIRLPVRFRLDD